MSASSAGSATLPGTAVAGGSFLSGRTGDSEVPRRGKRSRLLADRVCAAGRSPTVFQSASARTIFTAPGGQWFGEIGTAQTNSGAAWQNPGGGFAVGCTTLGPKDHLSGDLRCRINCSTRRHQRRWVRHADAYSDRGAPTPTPTVAPPTPTPTVAPPTPTPTWRRQHQLRRRHQHRAQRPRR